MNHPPERAPKSEHRSVLDVAMSISVTTVGAQQPLIARIRALGPSLSRAGNAIAGVVLAAPASVIQMTVTDLAAETGTSVGSVVRFCQDIGLRGFQDLKLQIAAETSRSPEDLKEHPEGSPRALLAAVFRSSAKAIADAEESVSVLEFAAAAAALSQARSVLFVGVGTSAPLAQDAAYRFKSIGVPSEAPADALNQHVAAQLLGQPDVCVAVSHTGQTRETLAAVGAAHRAGATTVAITSFYRSPLTDLCDHNLVAGSAETAYRIEAMTSRFPHLALLDSLHSAVIEHNPKRARAAAECVANALAEHRF